MLSPGSGAIIDSLGWAYFHAGDLARADIYLEQAGRLEPGDPEVLEHIGDQDARKLLEKLAQGAPAAQLTREAGAAVERLSKGPAALP